MQRLNQFPDTEQTPADVVLTNNLLTPVLGLAIQSPGLMTNVLFESNLTTAANTTSVVHLLILKDLTTSLSPSIPFKFLH